MEQNDALALFRRAGALLDGHFRLSSGLHSTGFMQSALVLQNPADAAALGSALAARVKDLRPDLVLSPALGGILIGHEVARALGVRALFAERSLGASLGLRRGFSLNRGERVLVVEDVFTTGGSTRETMEVARARERRGRSRGDRRSQWPKPRLWRAPSHARDHRAADLRSGVVPALRARRAGGEAGIEADIGV